MKSFIAILVAVAAIPLAGATGYALNSDPAPPSLKQTVERELKARPDGESEVWLYIVTKGPLRSQEADAFTIATQLTDKQLHEYGALAGKYVVRSCSVYTTTGDVRVSSDAVALNYCTHRVVTKKQVLEELRQVAAVSPSS